MHDLRRGRPRVLVSHPTLYAVGHALTEVMRHEGFEPDAVLGYSLGECIALGIADAISFADGMGFVMQQAELFKRRRRGGLLSLLASPEMRAAFPRPEEHYYVDLSARGTLSNFLRHGFGDRYRSAAAVNPFGNNAASMAKLRAELVEVAKVRRSA